MAQALELVELRRALDGCAGQEQAEAAIAAALTGCDDHDTEAALAGVYNQWRARSTSYGDVRDSLVDLPHYADGYAVTDIFTVRHRLIRELDPQPRSVFEFGALLGFFLVTALDAAPSIERVGWVDNESHSPGSNRACSENLASYLEPRGRDASVLFDTAACRAPRFGRADLVAVDAAHGHYDCLTDLVWALSLDPRTIMVDDYTAHEPVRDATRRFAAWQGLEVEEHETVNGLAVLRL